MSAIQHATNRSIKPFKSSGEYLYAMKEDLVEWLRDLYGVDITVINFLEVLETGVVLCHHANNVTRAAADFLREFGHQARKMHLPTAGVTFLGSAQPATFLARDNISNFINWCRKEMGIKDVLMFETEDLVLRKNEKNFVLCLLEVARRASRFGVAAPVLIQLENEIEEEIREEQRLVPEEIPSVPQPRHPLCDFKNVDEMVQHLVSRCTCPVQFPMVKVSEGKYRVGNSSTFIFVRILRNHVMVRVGGGWDTLEHYLDKHDPCRCSSLTHKQPKMSGLRCPAAAVHEVKTLLTPQHGGQIRAEPTLLVSRTQPPPLPLTWVARPGGTSRMLHHLSPSPEPHVRAAAEVRAPTPVRVKGRSVTSSCKDQSIHSASTITGSDLTWRSPSHCLASSFPQPIWTSPASQPDTQCPSTPLVLQETAAQLSLHLQPETDCWITRTCTKSQLSSKIRQGNALKMQNIEVENRVPSRMNMSKPGGLLLVGPSTPTPCYIPIRSSRLGPKESNETVHQTEETTNPLQGPDFIRTFSPTKQFRCKASDEPLFRVLMPAEKGTKGNLLDQILVQNTFSPNSNHAPPINSFLTGGSKKIKNSAKGTLVYPGRHGDSLNMLPSTPEHGGAEGVREVSKRYFFTPAPISPTEEASLYHSLEHEILSNLQLLSAHSDDNSNINGAQDGSGKGRVGDCSTDPVPCLPESLCAATDSVSTENSSVGGNEQSTGSFQLSPSYIQVRTLEVSPGLPADSRHCTKSSMLTMASSIVSKDLTEATKDEGCDMSGASGKVRENTVPMVCSMALSTEPSQNPSIPITQSSSPRRVLRRPEKVPSIYKLKLWPRIRPRRDHRPKEKPSRIPIPLSYRRDQPDQNSQGEKGRGDSAAASYSLKGNVKSKKDTPVSLQGCASEVRKPEMAAKETLRGQIQQTWV